MTPDDFYTFRAAIYQSTMKLRRYQEWVFPEPLKDIARAFAAIEGDKYYILVFGITRQREERIVNMISSNDMGHLMKIAERYPITLVHPRNQVIGTLAPRYGKWEIQQLAPRYRGIQSPPESKWMPRPRSFGTYRAMKALLHACQQEELRKPVYERRTFRMVPYSAVEYNGDKIKRKYFTWDYYHNIEEE